MRKFSKVLFSCVLMLSTSVVMGMGDPNGDDPTYFTGAANRLLAEVSTNAASDGLLDPIVERSDVMPRTLDRTFNFSQEEITKLLAAYIPHANDAAYLTANFTGDELAFLQAIIAKATTHVAQTRTAAEEPPSAGDASLIQRIAQRLPGDLEEVRKAREAVEMVQEKQAATQKILDAFKATAREELADLKTFATRQEKLDEYIERGVPLDAYQTIITTWFSQATTAIDALTITDEKSDFSLIMSQHANVLMVTLTEFMKPYPKKAEVPMRTLPVLAKLYIGHENDDDYLAATFTAKELTFVRKIIKPKTAPRAVEGGDPT